LRLFPPAASIRQGVEGVDLIDEEGNHYPTANCMVYILHPAIQRDPANFVPSREFLPERWLVGPEDPLYPNVKGAWRPFEYGPRNCIGQLQVMVEVKAVLALTVREFDIKPAYEEWDAKNPRKGLRTVDGNRASGRPRGGTSVRSLSMSCVHEKLKIGVTEMAVLVIICSISIGVSVRVLREG
jgi:cytochrome P450